MSDDRTMNPLLQLAALRSGDEQALKMLWHDWAGKVQVFARLQLAPHGVFSCEYRILQPDGQSPRLVSSIVGGRVDWEVELVVVIKGGGRERGARVSRTGLAVLTAYRDMEREASAIADRPAYAELRQYLRQEPVAPD